MDCITVQFLDGVAHQITIYYSPCVGSRLITFISYKYLYARCMHTLPIGFTFEFLERYNVSLTGLI